MRNIIEMVYILDTRVGNIYLYYLRLGFKAVIIALVSKV